MQDTVCSVAPTPLARCSLFRLGAAFRILLGSLTVPILICLKPCVCRCKEKVGEKPERGDVLESQKFQVSNDIFISSSSYARHTSSKLVGRYAVGISYRVFVNGYGLGRGGHPTRAARRLCCQGEIFLDIFGSDRGTQFEPL